MTENIIKEDTLFDYKCPNCGGKVEFDPELQKLKCPYCDSVFEIDDLKTYDELLGRDAEDNIEWENNGNYWSEGDDEGVSVYVCNSCGGEIVTDQTTAASSCPYCGNPVVMAGNLAGDLRPDYVLPFKISKEEAKAALTAHVSNKKLLPKLFRDQNHIDEIKGLYVPFWLFDADSTAEARWHCTTVRSWTDSKYSYTETSHYSVFRRAKMAFGNIPVDGSSQIANDLMESIEPFDFGEAVDFRTAYLSGYLADRYDVTEDECVSRASERLKATSLDELGRTVQGYSTMTTETVNVTESTGKAKYVLYPVWFLNTNWNGERYHFAVNGQTGKLVGNLPVDKKLAWMWFFIYLFGSFAVTFAIALLLGRLLGGM